MAKIPSDVQNLVDAIRSGRSTGGWYIDSVINDKDKGGDDMVVFLDPMSEADRKKDFASVPTFPKRASLEHLGAPHGPPYGPPVMICTTENTHRHDFEVNHKPRYNHLRSTSWVAHGVADTLLDSSDSGVVVIPTHLNLPDAMRVLSPLFRAVHKLDGYAVISNSQGEPDSLSNLAYEYRPDVNTHIKYLHGVRVDICTSAGNDGHPDKNHPASLDLQKISSVYWTQDVTYVGAIYHLPRKNGPISMSTDYTEDGAGCVAHLQVTKNGEELTGTSHATPFVAGVRGALLRQYGQSKENPYGLTLDEVKWAMSASANTDVAQYTTEIGRDKRKPMPFEKRADGVLVSKKLGFGEIDPLKAEELAYTLFEHKVKNRLKTPELVACDFDIPKVSNQVTERDGKYYREIIVPETMALNSMLLNLNLEKEWKDDPKTNTKKLVNPEKYVNFEVEYRGSYIPGNFGPEGRSNFHGMQNAVVEKGERLWVRTEIPVTEGRVEFTGLDATKKIPYLEIKPHKETPKPEIVPILPKKINLVAHAAKAPYHPFKRSDNTEQPSVLLEITRPTELDVDKGVVEAVGLMQTDGKNITIIGFNNNNGSRIRYFIDGKPENVSFTANKEKFELTDLLAKAQPVDSDIRANRREDYEHLVAMPDREAAMPPQYRPPPSTVPKSYEDLPAPGKPLKPAVPEPPTFEPVPKDFVASKPLLTPTPRVTEPRPVAKNPRFVAAPGYTLPPIAVVQPEPVTPPPPTKDIRALTALLDQIDTGAALTTPYSYIDPVTRQIITTAKTEIVEKAGDKSLGTYELQMAFVKNPKLRNDILQAADMLSEKPNQRYEPSDLVGVGSKIIDAVNAVAEYGAHKSGLSNTIATSPEGGNKTRR